MHARVSAVPGIAPRATLRFRRAAAARHRPPSAATPAGACTAAGGDKSEEKSHATGQHKNRQPGSGPAERSLPGRRAGSPHACAVACAVAVAPSRWGEANASVPPRLWPSIANPHARFARSFGSHPSRRFPVTCSTSSCGAARQVHRASVRARSGCVRRKRDGGALQLGWQASGLALGRGRAPGWRTRSRRCTQASRTPRRRCRTCGCSCS